MTLRKADIISALSGAPGPSPWYLRADMAPVLGSRWGSLKWTSTDESGFGAGKTVLTTAAGEVLLILGFYCYVLPITSHQFLVWYTQRDPSLDPTLPEWAIWFHLFNSDEMHRIPDTANAVGRMASSQERLAFISGEIWSGFVSLDHPDQPQSFLLPDALKTSNEYVLIALGGQTGEPPRTLRNQVSLVVINTEKSSARVYPQDWYNQGKFDTLYQWPTRIARELDTGAIVGEGIRLPYYVLDDTLRQVQQWIR